MSMFKLTSGTSITVAPDKSSYEAGDTVELDMHCSVDAKNLQYGVGGFWHSWFEVRVNKTLVYDGDGGLQRCPHVYNGTEDSNSTCDRTAEFIVPEAGTYNVKVVVKARGPGDPH